MDAAAAEQMRKSVSASAAVLFFGRHEAGPDFFRSPEGAAGENSGKTAEKTIFIGAMLDFSGLLEYNPIYESGPLYPLGGEAHSASYFCRFLGQFLPKRQIEGVL